MIISIDDTICNKHDLEIEEVLALILVKSGTDIAELFQSLEERKILVKDVFKGYLVTRRWDDVLSSILLDSDKNTQSPERLESLATALMEVFPKEKKAGTCHYFKCNKKDVILRLKKFFKLYGNQFTDEQMINAAKKYVTSFNGNYQYMRILKYFIWKDDKKVDSEGRGYIDSSSDLATLIENESSSDIMTQDWTSTLKLYEYT